ncbi:MAG: family ATPase, partial [Candidatus Hydrogenedentes bacterium]|nr:family ATPase [Candidatus Hydrogenedentota bacterium]
MRFCTLELQGYGRFFDRVLELSPGLQVVIGPNEQGKSTLRCFMGDMLYGQKRSVTQRLYDPSHELRRPWANPDCYGGRIVYHLDDGRQIEVSRNFDKRNESVQVYDRTNALDITDDFDRMRNREPMFAMEHLGLTKEVFLSTATMTHMTLDELGDRNALTEIREKLLSLADSGEDTTSADTALKWLNNRIAAIGQTSARSKPLPMARARLAELDAEREASLALRGALTEIEEQRRVLREEERGLRRRRVALQENLSALERIERAERLREIEALMREIDEVTKRCFALGAVREFPLDRLRDVQRTENAMANTKAQLARMRKERGDLAQQLETEKERLGPGSDAALVDIPEDVENRLAELESKIVRLRDRFDEAKATRDSAEERFKAAQETLARVPDFSPMSPDPMEWLTQLSSSLRVVQRARDEECGQRDRLNQDIDRRRAALSGPQRVFVGCENFPDMAREYELQRHDMDDQIAYLSNRIESLNADAEEGLDRIPDFRKMTILSGVLLCVLLGAAAFTGNMAPLFPAALTALALFYFAGNLLYIHDGARRAERDMGKLHDEIARLQRLGTEHGHTIEKMMRGADCQTLRELEALHEQYRDNNRELTGLEETA